MRFEGLRKILLAEQVDLSFSQQKMIAKLTSLFGLLALLLVFLG
jgi:hypothetical protein